MNLHKKIIESIHQEFKDNTHILAMFVTGSAARGEAVEGNDLDVLLVTDGERYTKEYLVGNILVELGSLTLPKSLNQIETSPMFVYMYLDAKAVFDKEEYLKQFRDKANQVLASYKPSLEEIKAVKKWLESVIDKVSAAEKSKDLEKISFCVSTNLWKTVEGLYLINTMPTPAFTSALRRVHDLKLLPENFEEMWEKILFGSLEERKQYTIELIRFVLSHLENI